MKMGKLCYLCNQKASKTENISLHSFPKDLTVRQKWLNVCGLNLNDDVSRIYICSIHFAETDIIRCNTFRRSKSIIKPGTVPSIFTNPFVKQEKGGDLSSEALTNTTINNDFVEYEYILPDIENKVEDKSKISENCNSTPMKHKLFTSEGDDVNNTVSDESYNFTPNIEYEYILPDIENKVEDKSKISDENCNSTPMKHKLFTAEVPNDHNYSIPRKQRKFFEPRYISEITTADVATPRRANRVIKLIKATDQQKSKRIKSLQDQIRKLKKRIKSLQDLVSHLKNKKIISEDT